MPIRFKDMSDAINRMTNNSESLYISGKGNQATTKSAGFFGRLFRSSKSFTTATNQFLNLYENQYGKNMRVFALRMFGKSETFGISVGLAKDLLKFGEKMKTLFGSEDQSVYSACCNVFIDKYKTSGANFDFDKAMDEVRVLKGLLSGAQLTANEVNGLVSALKGVTIPSTASLVAIWIARDPNCEYRAGVKPEQLSVLLNTCRHVFDDKQPMFNDTSGAVKFDLKDSDIIQSFITTIMTTYNTELGMMELITANLDFLAKLAKHGSPTKAMIVKVLFDLPGFENSLPTIQVDDNPAIRYKDMNLAKIDQKTLVKLFETYQDTRATVFYSLNDSKDLVKGSIFASNIIFQEDPNTNDNKTERAQFFANFARYVGSLTKDVYLMQKFKLGQNCPQIKLHETWSRDPAMAILSSMLTNSKFGKTMKTNEAIDKIVNQALGDLSRAGQTLKVENVEVKCKANDDVDVKNVLNGICEKCKSWTQKYAVLTALTQNGTMVMKWMANVFGKTAGWIQHDSINEHVWHTTKTVKFEKDGSVLVEIESSKEPKDKNVYGTLDLCYRISPKGVVKTERFNFDFPDFVKNGSVGS